MRSCSAHHSQSVNVNLHNLADKSHCSLLSQVGIQASVNNSQADFVFTTCNPVNTKYLWVDMERVNLSQRRMNALQEFLRNGEKVDSNVLFFFL